MTATVRPDGRQLKQLRELKVEVGNLARPDGSSQVRLGKNMVIASVFGPREQHPKFLALSDRANVKINYRMATFSVGDYKRSFPSRREKEISKVLSEAFSSVVITKHFPRSSIDIHVQMFESDGGSRTAAAIAVSAALADAGIPMRDLIGGIATGLYGDEVCLDLSGHEDMKGTGDMPILYSPELDEVSLFQLDGKFTFDQFKESFYTSIESIKEIVEVIKQALIAKYMKVKDEIAVVDDEEHEEDVQTIIQDTFISESVAEPTADETPKFNSSNISSFDPDDVPDGTTDIPEETVVVESAATELREETAVEAVSEPVSEVMAEPVSEPVSEPIPFVPATEEAVVEKTTEEVVKTEPVEDETWYEDSLGLKPMGKKETLSNDDVLRDIEYSFEEDD